jgi:surface protein
MSAMFYDCNSLQSVPLFDTSSVTSMSYMFQNCYSLQSVPLFDTSSVTNMQDMFRDCTSLQSVPAFDVSLVTDFTYIFFNNRTLSYVGANNVSYSISVAGCKLSNTALETIFTNLTDITPANNQTITITNNYGSSTANTTIATDKGWTVTN